MFRSVFRFRAETQLESIFGPILVPIWHQFPSLNPLQSSLAGLLKPLGCILGHLRGLLGHLRPSWRHIGSVLRRQVGLLGGNGADTTPCVFGGVPSIHFRGIQSGSQASKSNPDIRKAANEEVDLNHARRHAGAWWRIQVAAWCQNPSAYRIPQWRGFGLLCLGTVSLFSG